MWPGIACDPIAFGPIAFGPIAFGPIAFGPIAFDVRRGAGEGTARLRPAPGPARDGLALLT
ncbi:hypothetical protein Adu01nite_75200 [Paractinoplanes durhamensis]|uniref:Uncharacterized protein n=1 Tax=Paractinoplanes durhamensis TaxID=113563 RepID=A0ABQ3Z8K3_9ACTN|nr:hypothetical protein Adu01nite_75200 [Actinoplanes durhamensis]